MKQKWIWQLLTVIALFVIGQPRFVMAEETECSYKEINRLQTIASKITYNFENDLNNSFTLTFRNLSKEVYLKDEEGTSLFVNQIQGESMLISSGGYEGGKNYVFYVYPTSPSPCQQERLRTIYINLPIYNPYSARTECEGVSEFSLCQKWTNTSNIDEQTFLNRVNEYKKSLEKKTGKTPDADEEKKKSFLDYLVQYYGIVLIGIITVSITGIILIKQKERRDRGKLL